MECLNIIKPKELRKPASLIPESRTIVRSVTPDNNRTKSINKTKTIDSKIKEEPKKIKPKIQVYNLKFDFTNIPSTIDKKKLNKEFIKNDKN